MLANTQDLATLKRLANCSSQVLSLVHSSPRFPTKVDWANFSFKKTLLEYEAHFIDLALEDTGGVVSRAAKLLGFNHHQSLLSLLNGRHEVLRHRSTPIVPRRRSIIPQPSQNGTRHAKRRPRRKQRILYVESDSGIAKQVNDRLVTLAFDVDSCLDGTEAMEKMTAGCHYDLLLVNDDASGFSGSQLVRLARNLAQFRQTPIIVLIAGKDEPEIETPGPNTVLSEANDVNSIVEEVSRFMSTRAHED